MGILRTGILMLACLATPATTQDSEFTIRTSTKLIEIGVVAKRHGAPVRNLGLGDFILLDNGRVRPVAGVALDEQQTVVPVAPMSPDVFTNRVVHQSTSNLGGVTLAVIPKLGPDLCVELMEFLRGLRPADHIGVYGLGERLIVLHEYTRDSRDLVEVLAGMDRGYPLRHGCPYQELFPRQGPIGGSLIRPNGGGGPLEDGYLMMFRGLKAIVNQVAGIPGRKNLIWLGSGFSTNFGKLAMLGGKTPTIAEPNRLEGELRDALRAANHAHVAIYGVDPRGLMTGQPYLASSRLSPIPRVPSDPLATAIRNAINEPLEGLGFMAEQTGGRVYANRNDIVHGLREAVDDAKGSYILKYYPTEEDWDGRYHRLEIRTQKRGISLLFRRGYFARLDETADAWRTSAVAGYDSGAIPFDVEAHSLSGGEYLFNLRIAPNDLGLALQDGRYQGAFDLVCVQRNVGGEQIESQNYRVEVALPSKMFEGAVASGGLSYEHRARRQANATDVRFILHDRRTMITGSVTIPFDRIR